eukprot:CAMPEP_0113883398 /NCGR_PEP_ID=MMETSP0780_2-20120614/9571_1 /TAXON_ID=652834 /ORGANISM="Palpitomonas bilix" /LENGTH=479 /DNA_ID=CAMNT_0000870685 /DNA_START=163 /DNA_END=1599 /DNA_ORIENTATION=- /assembly_acc=CAM_ASM_000599
MYNGVGLKTARGTGTNGYVQRNLGTFRPKQQVAKYEPERDGPPKVKKANRDILEHEQKRKIEVKLTEFRIALEDEGFDEDEIERRVSEIREKLSANEMQLRDAPTREREKVAETHAQAYAKEQENEKFKRAFGISREHVVGAAFDRDLQEQKKQERIAEREAKATAMERREEGAEAADAHRMVDYSTSGSSSSSSSSSDSDSDSGSASSKSRRSRSASPSPSSSGSEGRRQVRRSRKERDEASARRSASRSPPPPRRAPTPPPEDNERMQQDSPPRRRRVTRSPSGSPSRSPARGEPVAAREEKPKVEESTPAAPAPAEEAKEKEEAQPGAVLHPLLSGDAGLSHLLAAEVAIAEALLQVEVGDLRGEGASAGVRGDAHRAAPSEEMIAVEDLVVGGSTEVGGSRQGDLPHLDEVDEGLRPVPPLLLAPPLLDEEEEEGARLLPHHLLAARGGRGRDRLPTLAPALPLPLLIGQGGGEG